jgi:uncharacterized protein YjbI with pentapeptide repeats
MKVPRTLADLPFASDLEPLKAALETDGDYDNVRFDDQTLTDVSAGGARFAEAAFTRVTFDGGRLRRCRLFDVWFGDTRFVAFETAESSFTDAWFHGCVLAGVQAFATAMRRVRFTDCKLDSVNFRNAVLTDVTFSDCVLRDVDFGSAKLTRVRFPGCQLADADFSKVSCTDVDLRDAALGHDGTPGIRAGYESLRGARIDTLQLMTLAPLLAHHLGITVEDS